MSLWKSDVFDGGYHPMQSVVLRVMRVVYQHFDPLHKPARIDHWWYSPSLSHQVDAVSLEPSIIILNLREGQPDYPAMDTHFMINLNTSRIHDKFKDIRYPCPLELGSDLEKLRQYVRRKVAAENEERSYRANRKLEVC
jgi:hypothetical protein